MLLGAHLSIAGGIERPLLEAERYGFRTVGMFVRSNMQWRSPRLTNEAAERFRCVRARLGIRSVVAHGMYLTNLAGRAAIRRRSITAVRDELRRCARLGIEYLVLHPGSREDPRLGVQRIARALDEILEGAPRGGPKVLLETTAGAGNCIGARFEELAEIITRTRRPGRLGVCLDTCHVFAAGHDVRTPSAYERTMRRFAEVIGRPRLRAVHVSDAKRPLGSHIDRHEHVGRGHIGLRGLAHFVNDPRLEDIPLILETPKSSAAWRRRAGARPAKAQRDWDRINADALRSLLRTTP